LIERASWAVYWNAAFFPLKAFIGFASSIIIVRLLRIQGYASYNVAMALLITLGLLADLGIERTLPRFYPEVEMRYGRRGVVRLLFWVSLIKAAVLVVLLVWLLGAPDLLLSVTGYDLGNDQDTLLLMIAALLVLGAASDLSIQLLYTHFRQKVTNSLDILAAIVNPSLRALFVLFGWGVVGAMASLLITTVISVVISVLLAFRLIRTIPIEPHPDPSQVKRPSALPLRRRLVSYAALSYLTNWSVYLYDLPFVVLAIGLLIVSPAEQAKQIAVVSLAYNFTRQFLRALVVPLTGVQTPLFARLYAQGRIEGLKTTYATLTKFLILALLPAGVGLIVIARNLLVIFYGQQTPTAGVTPRVGVLTELTLPEAVACTAILAFGLFGEAMISVALNVLMVYEEYRAVITARLVALISIPMLVLLVPAIGVVGAALAVAVAGFGSRAVALTFALRRLKLPFPGRFFVRVGAASSIMGYALLPFLPLFPPSLVPTIAMVVLGAGIFLAAFKLLGGIDTDDKERFRSLRLPGVNFALRLL
jgi:O-antigen/teichoic acid export membrane protein